MRLLGLTFLLYYIKLSDGNGFWNEEPFLQLAYKIMKFGKNMCGGGGGGGGGGGVALIG